MRTSIDVIVPAHNEEILVSRTLQSIAEQERDLDLKVFVIANSCDDSTAERAREQAHLLESPKFKVEVIETSGLGKPQALNDGLKYCTSDIVFCIDADLRMERNVFKLTLAAFDDPKVHVAGAIHSIDPETVDDSILGQVQIAEDIYRKIARYNITPCGSFMAFRRSAIDQFPVGVCSDDNWLGAHVAKKHGWDAVMVVYEANTYVVARQNWVDYVKQASRYAIGSTHLSTVMPELKQVIDEGRAYKRLGRPTPQDVEELTKMALVKKKIPLESLDYLKLLWAICKENGIKTCDELIDANGYWEPTHSTKTLPRLRQER